VPWSEGVRKGWAVERAGQGGGWEGPKRLLAARSTSLSLSVSFSPLSLSMEIVLSLSYHLISYLSISSYLIEIIF